MDAETTFHLAPVRRRVIAAAISFFLGFPLLLAIGGAALGDPALLATAGIVCCIMLPFAAYLAWWAWRTRLVLSESGVWVRAGNADTPETIPWTNIERLRLKVGSEGLVLREPLDCKMTRRLALGAEMTYRGMPMYDDEQTELIKARRYVPLDAFGQWFEKGRLLEAIQRFSPELVSGFEEIRTQSRREQERGMRTLRLAMLLVGLLIAAGIILGLAI